MRELVSFVIIVRDREAARVRSLVDSVRASGGDPSFIVVDYGSSEAFAAEYTAVCAGLDLRYERMFTQGLPWSRSHALNRGARLAGTRFVVTSDVDMLHATNVLAYCLEGKEPKTMYHVDSYPLPRSGDRAKARLNGRNSGPFQFVDVGAFHEAGGYDEGIKFWGQEELDWVSRLQALGYRQEWLPEPHRIYHQWHPNSESGGRRPATADYATFERCAANVLKPSLEQDWGRPVPREDRPILARMEGDKPLRIDLEPNELGKFEGVKRLCKSSTKASFVQLAWGERLVRRPLSAIADPVAALLRPVTALTGLSCVHKPNKNFDYFYAMLPALQRDGLLDYFISPDMSGACMLWAH